MTDGMEVSLMIRNSTKCMCNLNFNHVTYNLSVEVVMNDKNHTQINLFSVLMK